MSNNIIHFGTLAGRPYLTPFSDADFAELLALHPAFQALQDNVRSLTDPSYFDLDHHVIDDLKEFLETVEQNDD